MDFLSDSMNIRLTLRIEDIDEDVAEFILVDKNVQNENVTEWTRVEGEPVGPSYALVLKTYYDSGALKVEIKEKGERILNTEKEISDLFLDV